MVKKVKFIKERIDSIISKQNISASARALNLSISPLKRYYDRCIREGYLIKENALFQKGKKYSVGVSERSNQKGQILELHNVEIKIPVIDPNANWRNARQVFMEFRSFQEVLESHKNINISPRQIIYNFHDIKRFRVKTTSKSIILVQKKGEPLRFPKGEKTAGDLKNTILDIAFSLIPLLEKRFMVKLSPDIGIELRVTKSHYAFIKDYVAKHFKDYSLKVYVDKRLRTIVDKSEGIIHFEEVDAKESEPDAESWQRFVKNMDTGKFNEEELMKDVSNIKGNISGLDDSLTRLNPAIEALTEQIELHLDVERSQKEQLIKNNTIQEAMLDTQRGTKRVMKELSQSFKKAPQKPKKRRSERHKPSTGFTKEEMKKIKEFVKS